MQRKVGFVSLGCPKALVDSEQIITQLRAEGYEIGPSYDDADLVVINTCGFIESAIDESLATIGDALGQNGKVIVTGCLGAKGDIVKNTYPNVLAVTGPHALQEVMEAVHAHLPPEHDPYTSLIPPQGIKLTPQHYAYLKISEGCNHRCSFCIIPALRGDLVSRPVNAVLQEAQNLVAAGVKELLVISQDTSAYGVDTKYKTEFWNGRPVKTRFQDLVTTLGELDAWIRLHYVYPYPHVDEVIPLMAQGKLLPYLDIPFQHASPAILKAMKRPASSENVLERLARWRDICPDIVIRSTFIVGFPGETEREFEELLEFLENAQLDRVGCFKYSAVDGARANALPDQVDEDIKQDRLDLFMQVQEQISRNKLQHRIGQQLTVLVDEVNDREVLARSQYDAPEVDGLVIIEDNIQVKTGEWLRVKVIDSDEHDLYAEVVE
ncbi:MAG: ribosomal protein S12 methylthiotransferase RimO [Gammaproteobacteria bacterium SG8_15]|nr:MAG: ribosomal protein S12 methylthiotransferase RimO [Gammaproteobacteria bacterium SG8_15]